jgi:hypothetical protein
LTIKHKYQAGKINFILFYFIIILFYAALSDDECERGTGKITLFSPDKIP